MKTWTYKPKLLATSNPLQKPRTARQALADTTNNQRINSRNITSARRGTILTYQPYLKPERPKSCIPIQSPTKDLNDLLPGDIKDYSLGKILGQGAYAVVRKSRHTPSNFWVAVKSYDKQRLKQQHRRKNLRKQIEIMRKLDHPNIVKYYDAIKSSRHINIVVQLVSGKSLFDYLKYKINRRLSELQAKRIFKQIVQAVQYCHLKNISHRDLKLQNILLDQNLNPKIIDFGFSTRSIQKHKIFCGTPSYMAPQIVNRRQFLGQLADIWALGVILYVILSGQFPFKAPTDRELYRQISLGLRSVPEIIPISVRSLIKQMLRIIPQKRPSASKILQHDWFIFNQENSYKWNQTDLKLSQKLRICFPISTKK